jgi:hypothetical protein
MPAIFIEEQPQVRFTSRGYHRGFVRVRSLTIKDKIAPSGRGLLAVFDCQIGSVLFTGCRLYQVTKTRRRAHLPNEIGARIADDVVHTRFLASACRAYDNAHAGRPLTAPADAEDDSDE